MKNSDLFEGARLASWPMLAQPLYAGKFPQSALLVVEDAVGEPGISLCRSLICENPDSRIGCDCRSCQQSLSDHPDVQVLAPSPHTIKILDVRQALQSLAYRPLWSLRRVVLIQSAETLTVEAANLLLKSIEEPAGYVQFILTTSNPDQVLPTIRSRCQKFMVPDVKGQMPIELEPDWMSARPLLPEHVIRASRYVEQQYRLTQNARWLQLWEDLWQAYEALTGNANQEILRERLRLLWMM